MEIFFIDEPPGQLVGLAFTIKAKPTIVRVYFRKLKYVEKENLERNWDQRELLREKISRIEVYQGGTLILQFS